MSIKFVDLEDSPEVSLKGFTKPTGSEVSFSPLIHEDKIMQGSFDFECISDIEEFMGQLQVRIIFLDNYALHAMREMEHNAFEAFKKMDVYTEQTKRDLFFNDQLKLKLKVKKDAWAFTSSDRAFTPAKHSKLKPTSTAEVTVAPGFYYSKEYCGVYLTVKNITFPKAVKTSKK
jgi:hypothetical protein